MKLAARSARLQLGVAMSVAALLLSSAAAVHAMEDAGIQPFPEAQRVTGSDDGTGTWDFVLGSVERVRGQLRVADMERVQGVRRTAVYETPRGSDLERVFEFYRAQMLSEGTTRLFECSGRDCGRSTVWANQIFGHATLYGRDHDQYYLAVLREAGDHGELFGAYVVRRGNNQVYVHLEQVRPAEPLELDVTVARVEDLQQRGVATVARIPYDMRGPLPARVRDQLAPYVAALDGIGPGRLHLVCHLFGVAQVLELIERSNACADEARQVLDPESHLQMQTHGIGPLAPRNGRAESRIELLMPDRIER